MSVDFPFCGCGCGEKVTKKNNKYIWGHNSKDRIISNETRKKLSERMKGKTYEEIFGEERSNEIKIKIGIRSKEDRFRPIKGKTWDEFFGEEKAKKIRSIISEKNRNNLKFKERIGNKNPYYKGAKDSFFSHWSNKILFDEKRENQDKKIEVRCTYCSKWFVPSQVQLDNRIGALKRSGIGGNFYCSDDCKTLCPDHYQVLWPKNYKPYENNPYKNRVEVSSELRKMVFERDQWICQRCEKTESLECHHIDPVSQKPLLSSDIDSCITLCKECHKKVHMEIEGCKYNDLKTCKKEN